MTSTQRIRRTTTLALALLASLGASRAGLFVEPRSLAGVAQPLAASNWDPRVVRLRFADIDLSQIKDPHKRSGTGRTRLVELNLFSDVQLQARLQRRMQFGPGRVAWSGVIDGADHSRVTLVVTESMVVGNVSMPDGRHYEIRSTTDGTHVIRQIDTRQLAGCGADLAPSVYAEWDKRVQDPSRGTPPPQIHREPGWHPAHSSGTSRGSSFQSQSSGIGDISDHGGGGFSPSDLDDGTVVDILVLYTAQAREFAGGTEAMDNLIALMVADSNEAYAASGVAQRLNLVHTAESPYLESGDMGTDLERFATADDGNMDEVFDLRETYGADLNALIVSQPASCGTGSCCGLAYMSVFDGLGYEDLAFSVTASPCTANLTFAHEVGHNMGLHHDRETEPNAPHGAYSYSFGYRVPGEFRTIMAYDCNSGCGLIGRFSNPDLLHNGQPTGISHVAENSADAARSLNNAATIYSTYRRSVTEPAAPVVDSPSGTIDDFTPTFVWAQDSTATWYYLEVGDSGGPVFDSWYEAQQTCVAGTCAATMDGSQVSLPNGDYTWRLKGWNVAGHGTFAEMSFRVFVPPPATPTPVSPTGDISVTSPTYAWTAAEGATWYQLQVDGGDATIINEWFEAPVICQGEVCSVSALLPLVSGSYSWRVKGWSGELGHGAYSNPMQFSVEITLDAPIATAPVGEIDTRSPIFTWNAVEGAQHYELRLVGPDGTVFSEWFEAAQRCSGATCTATAIPLSNGDHAWRVKGWSAAAGHGPLSSALEFHVSVPLHGAPAVTSPVGTIQTASPTYVWEHVAEATHYFLQVDQDQESVVGQWFDATSICNNSNCAAIATPLSSGDYTWKTKAWSTERGHGPFSEAVGFSVDLSPATPNPLVPYGPTGSYYPTFTWEVASGATWYEIIVDNADGTLFDEWFEASVICGDVTCSIGDLNLGDGPHSWRVKGWSTAGGHGQFSETLTFSVAVAQFIAPETVLPAVAGVTYSDSPQFVWQPVDGASWYLLQVDNDNGQVLTEWLDSAVVCSGEFCSASTSTVLSEVDYSWSIKGWSRERGHGASSTPSPFTIVLSAPGAPSLETPSGTISTGSPDYTWEQISGTDWYLLEISTGGSVVFEQWFDAQLICQGPSCSTQASALPAGTYDWRVKGWNSFGHGAYSPPSGFAVAE